MANTTLSPVNAAALLPREPRSSVLHRISSLKQGLSQRTLRYGLLRRVPRRRPCGSLKVRIYDPEGRMIVQQRIRSNAGRTDDLYLGDQGSALYVIVVDAAQVAKWVPIR